MRAWLRRGAAAASLASDRSDLWPAASLAWLAYLGWLPLLLAVAPPQVPDVAHLAVQLVSSASFPANVVALCVAAVGGFVLLSLLAVLGEVALLRALRPMAGGGEGPVEGRGPPTLTALAIALLASTPALIALAWLGIGLVEAGPAVYSAPGPAGSVPARLAAAVLPHLCALALAVLAAQAIGGLALRRAMLGSPEPPGGGRPAASILASARLIGRRPGPWLGVAAAGWLKDALLLAVCWSLLWALWRPIGPSLGPGLLASPQVLALLVGFVAIWLSLLLAGGALHAFISAWWLAEWRSNDEA